MRIKATDLAVDEYIKSNARDYNNVSEVMRLVSEFHKLPESEQLIESKVPVSKRLLKNKITL